MNPPKIDNMPDERTPMGFPAIPFVMIWPIIRLMAVPLLRKTLPWLLRWLADAIEAGRPLTLSDAELTSAVDTQQAHMHDFYRGN